MRKLLLILFLSALTTPALAQKGSTLLYGSLQYVYESAQGGSSSFSINPGIGYGLSGKWTAGLNIDFSQNNNFDYTTFGAGPFVRYTHPLSEIFSVFSQFYGSYGLSDQNGLKGNTIHIGLFPAVEMNVKNMFALKFGFGGIAFTKISSEGMPFDFNSFNFSFGSGLSFGVSKRFGR